MIISICGFFPLLNPSFPFYANIKREEKVRRYIYIFIPSKGRLEEVRNPQSSAELALLPSQRCHGACGGGSGDVDGERILPIQ